MAQRIVQTSKRLAAERQIHAAIAHFHAGDFECDYAVQRRRGSDARGERLDLPFRQLRDRATECPAPHGQKDDFNDLAAWMKHGVGAEDVELEEMEVKIWLWRAISKYRAVYGIGTPEMATCFLLAARRSRANPPECPSRQRFASPRRVSL